MAVRDDVLKAIESAKQDKLIVDRAEAEVTISALEPVSLLLEKYIAELRPLFLVSLVRLERAESGNGSGAIRVTIGKAQGEKCERCWNYSVHVGENAEYPTVCERCSPALREIGSEAHVQ
jgi:isoleucyl-tRNA synthetase